MATDVIVLVGCANMIPYISHISFKDTQHSKQTKTVCLDKVSNRLHTSSNNMFTKR